MITLPDGRVIVWYVPAHNEVVSNIKPWSLEPGMLTVAFIHLIFDAQVYGRLPSAN